LPPPGSPGHSRYFSFQDFRGHCGLGSSLFGAGSKRWDAAQADEVGLIFESWSDTEIVISGFGDGYGAGCATYEAGDPVAVAVWNTSTTNSSGPQTAWGGRGGAPQASAEVQVPPPAQAATCAEFTVENTLIGTAMYPLVAWSPDGQVLASVSGATVWLRDPRAGRVVRALRGHLTNVYSLVFDPLGDVLASASRDGKGIIRLWNPRTGSLIRTLDPGDDAWAMAFSPNGRWLASGGAIGPVQLWDVRTGSLLRTFSGHGTWVLSVAFSPDGGVLASGGRDRAIKLWDPNTGSLVYVIPNAFSFHIGPKGQTDWPPYAAPLTFSPDGSSIASASGDGKIRIWNSRTGGPIHTLTIPSINGAKTKFYTDVWSVTFAPDGRCLASGSWDGAIRLWDSTTGALVHTLGAHAGPVMSVVFSRDGRRLASASHDSSIKLWKRVDVAAEGRPVEPTLHGAGGAPSVSLGQTVDEVIAILGKPDQIVDLGTRVVYVYKGRKIVFTNGKVTDPGVDRRVREN
jgi:WD40 repeat protein